jgi:hypothetical protein
MAMLFVLTGSSGAGKSSVLAQLPGLVEGLLLLDVDDLRPPPDVVRGWWQEQVEALVRRAVDAQSRGVDAILAGWTPLGEILAAPSALELEGIAAMLLDCDDKTRTARLASRTDAGEWWRGEESVRESLRAAAWMRAHAVDPSWEQGALRAGAWPDMRWERWVEWEAGDRRWVVELLDTTLLSVAEVADEVAAWISRGRESLRDGTLPLSRGWWEQAA